MDSLTDLLTGSLTDGVREEVTAVVVGVVAALAAGLSFAAAGVLQQRAAASVDAATSLSPKLLVALARRPLWVAGIGAAFASYAFQALALAFAPLTVVQPLIVTELVFAIPISARLYRVPLTRREWLGIVAVAAGLSAALWGAAPSAGDEPAAVGSWAVALLVAVGGAAILALLVRRAGATVRAAGYAAAAAVVLGTQSGLLDQTVELFATGGVTAALTSWAPYTMAAASVVGLLLVQSAFQAGPLAVSLPVIDTVEPAVAVVLGVSLLGETLNTGAVHHAVLAVGVTVLFVGIVALDTSATVRALHQAQAGFEPAPASAVAEPAGAPSVTAAAQTTRCMRRCAGMVPDLAEDAASSQAGPRAVA